MLSLPPRGSSNLDVGPHVRQLGGRQPKLSRLGCPRQPARLATGPCFFITAARATSWPAGGRAGSTGLHRVGAEQVAGRDDADQAAILLEQNVADVLLHHQLGRLTHGR